MLDSPYHYDVSQLDLSESDRAQVKAVKLSNQYFGQSAHGSGSDFFPEQSLHMQTKCASFL